MLNLSYNLSDNLKKNLEEIEMIRRNILSAIISPESEIKFRWNALIDRIYWSMHLSAIDVGRGEIQQLISLYHKKKLGKDDQKIIGYKKALDYISQNFLVVKNPLPVKSILTLNKLCQDSTFWGNEKDLKQLVDYLSASSENPIIQAAVAQIQIIHLKPFSDGNGRIARLVGLLYLYKSGYDFRGMLAVEEYWGRDKNEFISITRNALQAKNLTIWLEYYTRGMISSLERTKEDLSKTSVHTDFPETFWNLSDRQKEILTLLEEPGLTLTNRKIQQLFKVSQITASRDLTKLATLGLIFPHGKGRSVSYTKI